MDALAPPRKSVELEDPGAHELGSSDVEDHFSDASEGRQPPVERSSGTSPVPLTRVERVDDKPAYGEVPGTPAYKMRTWDAVPDEVEVVPEGQRSRSSSWLRPTDRPSTPRSPGGTPLVVVERVDDKPSHGEVPGTEAHAIRKADAAPDVILKAPQKAGKKLEGSPTSSVNRSPSPVEPLEEPAGFGDDAADTNDDDGIDEGFGDEFDDFEEGGQEDDDFGDFGDGFEQADQGAESAFDQSFTQPSAPVAPPSLPIPNFDDSNTPEDIQAACQPYISELFPSLNLDPSTDSSSQTATSLFLSERSLSLWSQLVAPPPLQPPNWVRSRIRRLFLVSLGVPVDLDEILPASKQKKLILPSINLSNERSPRPSSDNRGNGAVARLKQGNDSSASVNSSTSKAERKRRGPPPPPELDVSSTTMLCSTTELALRSYTDEELEAHVARLKELQIRASEVLEYWLKQKDSAMGDKDAFEGVIENLVKHAKKVRE
ncbi:hypothetical protein W97_06441 [Coniosporium apollinis CBS 100218]|uniref:Uncharacterized protein n=1 Tax=Coniosporium apollinis (strain CBS 100218) TaxID=1168221 RepID=R7YZC7_CONA1|nr:uncharacterized protein W97_06441 [Coniosporium apollinis CBS 100218]EON67188.1 hypothetical protein W97_06441 [Coniosporium apollinis CBS 100218]